MSCMNLHIICRSRIEFEHVQLFHFHFISACRNIIDIVTFVVLFILIILHALDVAAHSEQLAHSVARCVCVCVCVCDELTNGKVPTISCLDLCRRLSCPAVILVWVRLLKHLRGFKSLGEYEL